MFGQLLADLRINLGAELEQRNSLQALIQDADELLNLVHPHTGRNAEHLVFHLAGAGDDNGHGADIVQRHHLNHPQGCIKNLRPQNNGGIVGQSGQHGSHLLDHLLHLLQPFGEKRLHQV
ncbi:hypothetical protein D3C81_1459560 [compost metagenome]